MEEAVVTIVGAGVVGLAVAAELAARQPVLVLERNSTYGQETSSRNSEVIHAGIYYPPGSLKASLCVEGNHVLYRLCSEHGVGHQRLGKVVVATEASEVAELERLLANGRANGATLQMLSTAEVRRKEPTVAATAALYSPNTGIVDSHGLMRHFLGVALHNDAQVVFGCQVAGIENGRDGLLVDVRQGEWSTRLRTRVLVNAAGLSCDRIAAQAGIDIDSAGYRLRYCKGEYFSSSRRHTNGLVYPVPETHGGGLGVHFTVDMQGRTRLGPNTVYVDQVDYSVDSGKLEEFWQSARRLVPDIQREHLAPEFAGVRPRLQGPGEPFRDFVIREESERGLPGLINLIGIESPGLTAAPAIGRYVGEMVRALLN